jgi:hypothetical protein
MGIHSQIYIKNPSGFPLRFLGQKKKVEKLVNHGHDICISCKDQTNMDKGGLGIINFQHQNEAILIKHLHKFYSKKDIPWVKLISDIYYIL